ncbi:hypothetical protein [Homoserinibacter sp. GY 40078]|uniref:hypothetical protein n=1 Tax=Homoserinibacter sp. GY 40078 TaxID=2603275 RepID=UPI0011C89751|nr:hypothetical protein [Homoserinibacter sp. GY 40078]TXK18759.1 hypothetical protein FVQ89_02115 [Homoserinibacter sp. GY 40078]
MFALCERIDAAAIEVRVGPGGKDPLDYPPIWKVEGEHVFEVGDTIVVGQVPDDMEEVQPVGEFDPARDGLDVTVLPSDRGGNAQESWWGPGAVQESEWTSGLPDDPCQ